MVVIRLARAGSKKRPFYHINVCEKRMPRDGRFIERLGYFNPTAKGAEKSLEMNLDRFDHWFSHGALPSDTVKQLVKSFKKTQVAAA